MVDMGGSEVYNCVWCQFILSRETPSFLPHMRYSSSISSTDSSTLPSFLALGMVMIDLRGAWGWSMTGCVVSPGTRELSFGSGDTPDAPDTDDTAASLTRASAKTHQPGYDVSFSWLTSNKQ